MRPPQATHLCRVLAGILLLIHTALAVAAAQGERWQALEATFTAWLDTVRGAVADTRLHARVDPERIGLVGFSLGGFLATSAAVQTSLKVRCVVELFGGLPRRLADQASHMPPALIVHGDRDEVVPVREADALRELLKERRRGFEVKVYSGVGHGFVTPRGSLALVPAADAARRTLSFLARHLSQERPVQAAPTARAAANASGR